MELFARAGFHERAFQALHGLETDIAQDELHHADVLAAQVRLLLDAGDRDAAVVAFEELASTYPQSRQVTFLNQVFDILSEESDQ